MEKYRKKTKTTATLTISLNVFDVITNRLKYRVKLQKYLTVARSRWSEIVLTFTLRTLVGIINATFTVWNSTRCTMHTDILYRQWLVLRSLLEIVSPMFGKYCSTPKAESNISQTKGKQFPIVTDNTSLYLFCYTSNSTSNIAKSDVV